jgi:hypothetical protein
MPETPENDDSSNGNRRHWLDHAAVWAATAAALAAAAAAGVGSWQGIIANQQLAVSKDTEIRQLRAYLYVRHYPIDADQTTASAKIEIWHAGSTPAYRIKLDTQMMVGQYLVGQLSLPDITSPSVGPVERVEHSILYSTEFIPQTVSMPKYSTEATRAVWSKDPLIGDNRFYVHGVVRYLDVFGVEGLQPETRYEFCFVYHPERDPNGSERGCEKYNKPG